LRVDVSEYLSVPGVRDRLGLLADAVVPARDGRPSATEVDVHTRHIDVGLGARPDLLPALDGVLARVQGADDLGSRLAEVDEHELEPVVELLLACYFMAPQARRSIDYPGQKPVPIAEGEAEYYLEEADLDIVVRRGSIWRSTPDDPTGPTDTEGL
jgi:hypothetical protein